MIARSPAVHALCAMSRPLTFAYLGAQLTRSRRPGSFAAPIQQPGEKISEHAKGDAIDVVAFHLDNEHARTVKDARRAPESTRVDQDLACGGLRYFTTILGRIERGHKDHLHFDYEMRGDLQLSDLRMKAP